MGRGLVERDRDGDGDWGGIVKKQTPAMKYVKVKKNRREKRREKVNRCEKKICSLMMSKEGEGGGWR